MPIIEEEEKVGYIRHHNIHVMKYCHGLIELWIKNHLVSDNTCNIVNL